MNWFKFYGTEYLADQKVLELSACERSCWITLLSYASQGNGTIKNVSEPKLMQQAGVGYGKDEWDETRGVLNHFKKLGMITVSNGVITVCNWKKRQESSLTNAERQAKFRERNKEVTDSNERVTLDKKRVEEIREDKKELNTSPQTAGFKTNYLSKFKTPKKIYSSKHLLASEISVWAAEKLKIPMLMKFCGDKGEQFVRECWATAKDSGAKDPVAIFMHEYGKVKINLGEKVKI